jgi:hypothetical protein
MRGSFAVCIHQCLAVRFYLACGVKTPCIRRQRARSCTVVWTAMKAEDGLLPWILREELSYLLVDVGRGQRLRLIQIW